MREHGNPLDQGKDPSDEQRYDRTEPEASDATAQTDQAEADSMGSSSSSDKAQPAEAHAEATLGGKAQHDDAQAASEKPEEEIHEESLPEEAKMKKKLPIGMKVLGFLQLLGGLIAAPIIAFAIIAVIEAIASGEMSADSISAITALVVLTCSIGILTVMFIVLGIRILRSKRRHAAETARAMIAVTIIAILADIMLFGINSDDLAYGILLVILIALTSYLDPSLAQERALQRKLRQMDARSESERGDMAGRDATGKGFITLNFFNLFWIFVVCCIIGLAIETVYHYFLFHEYQDRAGMLFGPFSPIYGFGALLMTIALNRFHNKPLIFTFLISALIGGAFEYFVSWFMQSAFGIIAWDYSGTWLSINGRTNGQFMIMWGILGVVWVRLLLPQMLKLVNLIPWNWRYTLTTIAAILMLADGLMTLQSLDCWYERKTGKVPDAPVEQFYATYFDDDFMANRFQSMSIDPTNAVRNT